MQLETGSLILASTTTGAIAALQSLGGEYLDGVETIHQQRASDKMYTSLRHIPYSTTRSNAFYDESASPEDRVVRFSPFTFWALSELTLHVEG